MIPRASVPFALALTCGLAGASLRAQPLPSTACDGASAEVDRIDAECRPGEASSTAQEECARGRLEALFARCATPWVRLNLGVAEMNLQRWSRAWTLLEEALESHDADVDRVRPGLEPELRRVRGHVARVAPTANAPGATVEVNGSPGVALPLARPIVLDAGEATIVVRAPGHREVTRRVRFVGGEEFTEAIVLEREAPAVASVPAVVPAPPRTSSARRVVAWTLVATGAAAVVTGAVFWALSSGTADALSGACESPTTPEHQRACDATPTSVNASGARVGATDDLCRNATGDELTGLCARNGWQPVAAWAAAAGGGVMLATGLVLALTERRERAPRVGVTSWFNGDAGGVVLRGSF